MTKSIDTDIVIQQLIDGYVEVDLGGYIVKYNLAAEKLFEDKTNKLFGKSFPKLFEEHTAQAIPDFFKKLLKDGVLNKFQATIKTKSNEKHVEISSNLLYKKGKPDKVFNIIRDVTESYNKQAETKILATRLQNSEEAANLGCFEYKLGTEKHWWSNQMFEIYDLTPSNRIPDEHFVLEICHPEDKTELKKQLENVHINKKDYNIIHRVITEKGNLKWLRKKGTYKRLQGMEEVFFGTVQDVTDLYQEKEKNRRNQKIIEIVNEAQQFLISEGDPYNVLHKCCKYLAKMINSSYVYIYKNDDQHAYGDYLLTVHSKYEIIEEKTVKRFNYTNEGLENYHKILKAGKVLDSRDNQSPVEKQFLNRLGIASTLVVPIHLENKFYGFLGFDNIKEEHHWLDTEKDILFSFARKLGFFMQRAEFLLELEQNLIREQKQNVELSKINKEIDNFVYATFHDLRAPIMNMQGLLNIIKLQPTSPEEIYPKLEKLTNKLFRAVSEIGDYAKNLRISLNYTSVNIDDFKEYITNQFDKLNTTQEVELDYKTKGNNFFYTDLMRFNIVLQNLLNNAIFFSKSANKPKVSLEINIDHKNTVLVVSNNGDFISKKDFEGVFEMFAVFNLRSEGSGLGLYIAKETIYSLGGKITVNSSPKETTFTVTLPNYVPKH